MYTVVVLYDKIERCPSPSSIDSLRLTDGGVEKLSKATVK